MAMTNMTATAYPSMFADTMKRHTGIELEMQFPLCPSRYVVWGLVFYVTTILFFQPDTPPKSTENSNSVQTKKKSRSPKPFGVIEAVIFVHNLVLAIFSLCCFVSTAPIMFSFFAQYGYGGAICRSAELYDPAHSSYGMWAYLFYLSKYWEFIDTFIVMARGRRPIFLQEYHHFGAVISMWLVLTSRSSAGYLFIVQNSLIHTIMYSYYAASVMGYRFRLKHWITRLQMAQFTSGIGFGAYQLYAFGDCMSSADKLCVAFTEVYVGYLFFLFARFYQRSYAKKSMKKVKAV